MSDELFRKKAEFLSWCIEEYAAAKNLNGRDVANLFSQKKVLDFLGEHYGILHAQGKSYIIETIEDFIRTWGDFVMENHQDIHFVYDYDVVMGAVVHIKNACFEMEKE